MSTEARRRPGARAAGATRAPTRAMRVPDEEWRALEEIAAERGVTVATVAREAFREYLAKRQSGEV